MTKLISCFPNIATADKYLVIYQPYVKTTYREVEGYSHLIYVYTIIKVQKNAGHNPNSEQLRLKRSILIAI
jgi:hypothetical protein